MKKLYYTLLLITYPLYLSYASDTLEDVQAAYERSMHRVDEQGLSENDSELANTDTHSPSLEKILLDAARKFDIAPSHVITREQLLKNNEEFNSRLFHTLTASISMLDSYISHVKNDDSHEWTFRNGGIFTYKNQKLPLEGTSLYYAEIDNNSSEIFVSHRDLYEIERQKTSLQLTTLWTLFIFWKKTMFPHNSFDSYNSFRANALYSQVSELYARRKEAFENWAISNKNEHFSAIILNMLEKINNSMPKVVKHIIKLTPNKMDHSSISKKVNKNCENLEQKNNEFYQAYANFIEQAKIIDMCLTHLQTSPYKFSTNQFFGPNTKILYKNYQDFKFPGEKNKKIRFFTYPLNFERLFPKLIERKITLVPTVTEELTPSISFPHVTSTTSSSETALKKKDIYPEKTKEVASSTRFSSVTSTTSSSETISKEKGIYSEEDEIIYDKAYWQEQHRYHEERKKASQKLISNKIFATELTSYEGQLHAYLNESIYKYVRRKGRELIQELKELKFKVVPNSSGNGSLHYVYPADDNPLFGMHPDYAEAYFNIHLPHDKGDIIPSAYFDFIKSGFSNVFGLTFERINNIKLHA